MTNERGEMDYIDDDENVKAMRETAREIGLTELLVRAYGSTTPGETQDLILEALKLLGFSDENRD
jgi:hypothetical protein